MVTMESRALPIYLNDHLALITGEVELIDRVRDENDRTQYTNLLCGYDTEVRTQLAALRQMMAELQVESSRMKQAAAWLAEKMGRMKPNDGLIKYTDLARVLEAEALLAAATTRRSLWRAMLHGLDPSQLIDRGSLRQLLAQSASHIRRMEDFHRAAVLA